MQESNARTLRGVSIAVVVLAVLAILTFLLGAIAVGIFGAIATDPSLYGDGIAIDGYNHGRYDSLSPEGVASIVGLSLGIAIAFLVWGMLCSAVSLIAGILGIRNHDKPEKLGAVFGWSIAGAIVAFLSGRIITTVLLVVAAVYAHKLRNPAPAAYAPQPMYGQPYQAQQPYAGQQQYVAPQSYAGQQPYADQPYAVQQPVVAAQPDAAPQEAADQPQDPTGQPPVR